MISDVCIVHTGITLHTNAHGRYLGDPEFDPVFEELNRRKAIVFLHPTTPCMLTGHAEAAREGATGEAGSSKISPLSQYPAPMMEFLFDTARAVINMFMSGVISRYPDITYIVPHCGGTLPPLIDRFSMFASLVPAAQVDRQVTPDYVRAKLRSEQFFFDMAGVAWPNQCPMLLPYIDVTQLLYGSDFPYTSQDKVELLAEMMDKSMDAKFEEEEVLKQVYSGNASDLLARRGWSRQNVL